MCKSRATFSRWHFFVICLPIIFTLIIFRSPAFVTALFVLGVLPALSEHTPSMHKTAPFSNLPHRISHFIPSSAHLSITTLHLSLLSLCCGLCPSSLSELLSPLSAPSVETKSSSAHGKRRKRNKRDSAKQTKKGAGKEGKLKERVGEN